MSQKTAYGATVSTPRETTSTKNSTWLIPSSSEASAETDTVPETLARASVIFALPSCATRTAKSVAVIRRFA